MPVSDLNGPDLEIVGIVAVEGEGQMVLHLEAAHKDIPGRRALLLFLFSFYILFTSTPSPFRSFFLSSVNNSIFRVITTILGDFEAFYPDEIFPF